MGLLTEGVEDVSDSFPCSWYHFPPTGLTLPALMEGFKTSLGGLFFSEGKEWSSSRFWGQGSFGDIERSEERGNTGWDVLCERRINT